MNKKNSIIGLIIYISAILLLAAGFIMFILEKKHITDLYTKPLSAPAITESTINKIDLSPPTQEQQQASDQNKQEQIDSSSQQTPSSNTISVILSAAGQDYAGGPLTIRTIVDGATVGSCTITIAKDSILKEYTVQIVSFGTYYGCEGLDIPASDLSSGSWLLNVEASSGELRGSTSQKAEVVI